MSCATSLITSATTRTTGLTRAGGNATAHSRDSRGTRHRAPHPASHMAQYVLDVVSDNCKSYEEKQSMPRDGHDNPPQTPLSRW
jgi:hypothetical protein